MSKNANEPAYPGYTNESTGLTKRELIAAMAMQGLMASDINDQYSENVIAITSVKCADALLEQLEK